MTVLKSLIIEDEELIKEILNKINAIRNKAI